MCGFLGTNILLNNNHWRASPKQIPCGRFKRDEMQLSYESSLLCCDGISRHPVLLGFCSKGNKPVQHVLKSIKSKHIKSGLNNNWTCFLGQVTSCCNNHASQLLNSVSSYNTLFGQDYNDVTKCNISKLQQCWTI
jgi:hypothetical protein